MGNTPTTKSNTRNNLVPPEKKLGDPMADYPEPIKAILRKNIREINALFPSKLGESSTETEREKESEALFSEFMRGGACKEAFTAYSDCAEETGAGPRITKCKELYVKLRNCTHAHHHYYQPYLEVMKSFEQDTLKNLPALLAARKQR